MISKYYVTPTLLNAWLNGYDSFLPMLRREEIITTEAMERGNQFEKDIVDGVYPELDFLEGALYQTLQYRAIDEYIGVFGYSDFMKFDTIYDAKSTSNYELGKYRHSCQHLVYTYCSEIENFEYIIQCNKEIYFEGYSRDDSKLFSLVRQFIWYLKSTGLKNDFEANYKIERKIQEIKEANLC